MPPHIRIWSDYSCPFCYVALERAGWLRARYGAVIEWRPFLLHPEAPPAGYSAEQMDARFGPAWRAAVGRMFEAAGLPHSARRRAQPNSLNALRLAELARRAGRHEAAHRLLFSAYWLECEDIGDAQALAAIGAAAGLGAAAVADLLRADDFEHEVRASTAAAYAAGATGVPAFLVDDGTLISGAQPHAVFERGLATRRPFAGRAPSR